MRVALASDSMDSAAADLACWAESGAMALTGPANGAPSAAPAAIAPALVAAAADLRSQTARWGRAVDVDGPGLLGERAAIAGFTRNGSTSVGGAARFVEAADGWIALNLPRPEDVAALPALISTAVAPDDWPAIERGIRSMTSAAVLHQATLLGMAVGVPAGGPRPAAPGREVAPGGGRVVTPAPLVIDLTSLWAGPLASGLLASAGARVIKVEGRGRPDGARLGSSAFFDLLNHAKECVEIDFGEREGVALLRQLISSADLVIEGSRPRVMDALGIDPAAVAAAGTSWLSITAHGRTGPDANRIGFGDDAAVSGGLVVPGAPPMFVADAVADPLTGVVAAVLGAGLLASERAAVMEAPLARASAWAARKPNQAVAHDRAGEWSVDIEGDTVPVAPPRHRPVPKAAPPAGAHSASIRAEFGDQSSSSPG